MKPTKKLTISAAALIALGSFAGGAEAAMILVSVNAKTVDINNALGSDFFGFSVGNGGTAFFFGNNNGANLNTANRVPLDSLDAQQYFQADTIIPPILGSPQGSTRAYFFDSTPFAGGTAGYNFSTYDANQNGSPDTVFLLDFGPSIDNSSDDIIVAYAFDTALSGIDVSAARAALIVPEPSGALLLGFAAMGLLVIRQRKA